MKILAIGNSFSKDATRYLHDIALADEVELKVVNLYIGGCSLETHIYNTKNNLSEYAYELNGQSTCEMISIKAALLSDTWDVVTMQQVSNKSINYQTFQPYLTELSQYVSKYAPQARQMIHQTWSYQDGSDRLTKELSYSNHTDMFNDLKNAYDRAAKDLGNLRIIPSGLAFQIATKNGLKNLHRDTFHASLGLGRYILGALWYEILTGNSIQSNSFSCFDEPISELDLIIAKRSVRTVVSK